MDDQSILSNGSEQGRPGPAHLGDPERRSYSLELQFLHRLKSRLESLQADIQKVLIALTNCQQAQQKRLPYTILRSFQTCLQNLRSLVSSTRQQNQQLELSLVNRQKEKQLVHAQFKAYLKSLGDTRHQLKNYMTKVQTRVRKLQDTGYAQYVEYEIVVPETNTIRLSYCARQLVGYCNQREEFYSKLRREIIRNRGILERAGEKIQGSEQELSRKLLLSYEQLSAQQLLSCYLTYRYFCAQSILLRQRLRRATKKQQLQIEIHKIKQSLHSMSEQLYKQQLKLNVINNSAQLTKTDHLIYLKQMQIEIRTRTQQKIFRPGDQLHRNRSISMPCLLSQWHQEYN